MQTGRLRDWRHDLHRIPELGLREHRPGYDCNDDILEIGVRHYVNLVRAALTPAQSG